MARWFRLGLSVAGAFGCRCLTSSTMLRFHFPLIEPDVRISRIRLSDWIHHGAHGARECTIAPWQKLLPERLVVNEVARHKPIARPLFFPTAHQNQGPFALRELPRFVTTTSLSATPTRPGL